MNQTHFYERIIDMLIREEVALTESSSGLCRGSERVDRVIFILLLWIMQKAFDGSSSGGGTDIHCGRCYGDTVAINGIFLPGWNVFGISGTVEPL